MMGEDKGSSTENILLVANYESNVGFAWWLMENFWVEISKRFEQRGCQTFLIFPRINDISQRIRDSSIRILQHDFDDGSRRGLMSLKTIVQNNGIRHVYLTDKRGYDKRYWLLRRWGVKRIVNHGHYYTTGGGSGGNVLRRLVKFLVYRTGLVSCDYYIAVSEFLRDQMVGGWGVPPRKCSVILNGIEPIECHPEDRYYAHEVFGIPNDGVIVVSTGRATFFKGIDSLIKCAKLLIEQGNARLYFLHCGDGPDLAVFKGMVDAYGLGGRFILAGKRTDVRKILPSCHIGIQMSRGEGFSLSLLEYLSAGLATLATDVGGNREAIMNGKTGILFPLDDLDSVVKTIEELARNDRHREELGAAARESVRVKFNIERTNREFIGLLEGILTA